MLNEWESLIHPRKGTNPLQVSFQAVAGTHLPTLGGKEGRTNIWFSAELAIKLGTLWLESKDLTNCANNTHAICSKQTPFYSIPINLTKRLFLTISSLHPLKARSFICCLIVSQAVCKHSLVGGIPCLGPRLKDATLWDLSASRLMEVEPDLLPSALFNDSFSISFATERTCFKINYQPIANTADISLGNINKQAFLNFKTFKTLKKETFVWICQSRTAHSQKFEKLDIKILSWRVLQCSDHNFIQEINFQKTCNYDISLYKY